MNLTEHYTLEEFTRSATAQNWGIDNSPNAEQFKNIQYAAQQMEKVRALLGNHPIIISSGLRSQSLNKA